MGFHFTIITLFLTEQEQTSNITESLQLRCSVPRNQPVFSQSEKGQYQSRFIVHTAFHALDTMILQLSFPTSHFCLFPPSEYTHRYGHNSCISLRNLLWYIWYCSIQWDPTVYTHLYEYSPKGNLPLPNNCLIPLTLPLPHTMKDMVSIEQQIWCKSWGHTATENLAFPEELKGLFTHKNTN